MHFLATHTYLDKAIMEEETDGCRNSDKSLLKFLLNFISDNLFYIWADISVIILSQLCQYGIRKQAQTERK